MEEKVSVRKAVIKVFNESPEKFTSYRFCELVKQEMRLHGRHPMDGTILRKLRLARTQGLTPYVVVDNQIGLYQKIMEEE